MSTEPNGGLKIRAFAPQISVKLIKAVPRKELVEGVPVDAKRYGDLAAIDLWPYISESGEIHTAKSVRECGGGFTIVVADKPHRDKESPEKSKLETLYALVEPMDLIEIRMAHGVPEGKDGRPPVVMRGFVSEVVRSEAMSGDRPQRTVTISGQDMGKVLQLIQIFFLNNSVVGENILSPLAFFHKYADGSDAKIKPANDFLKEVLEAVVNPYLKQIVSLANGETVGAKVINEWTLKASVEGAISPFTVASIADTGLDQMLEQLLDVGPFNELYVEDTEEGVQLVARPAPFWDVTGKLIQGEEPAEIVVAADEVVSIGLTRSDRGVANYYWVTDSRWVMMNNEDAKMAAQYGQEKDFILFEYPNAKAALYGVRKMEVPVLLGPPDSYSQSDAVPAEQMPTQNTSLGEWLAKRRKILADANKDNVLFEVGTAVVRGNEKIKAGMKVRLKRGAGKDSVFYAVKVEHSFRAFGGFTSQLTLERGTNFIERSQTAQPNYFLEIAPGAAK